ncbi:hypothetical protein QR680_001700 [Steinernema hermaphroditum]|uniref:LRRCT domain-containing protein n=1 Tax=Steinernema hermaphroditum TaxID=289476 RepID=A0AA39H0B1_9BILA|nr:hypothetical protein QR680_001700 [Steinernema hermaphroditum]
MGLRNQLPLFLIVIGLPLIHACPLVVQSVCACQVLPASGVSLNCSNTDGLRTLRVLLTSQAQLGLIQQLILENAQLNELPDGLFKGLYIKRLDLSNNQISAIGENAFDGLGGVLSELYLNKNALSELPSNALRNLNGLARLDLSNNSITELNGQNTLPSLPKLFDVNFGNNKIEVLHKSAFENVKNNVQTINLGNNRLRSVPASAIRGFKQLRALHMHNNAIEEVEALAFMNLPVLDLLNLANNKIANLHRQAFLNVPNLRLLYLTENRIDAVFPQQFGAFEQLEMIDLTGNRIAELQSNTFSNHAQLRQLYLGKNKISSIKKEAFANSSIVILLLDGNELSEITDSMFEFMSNLKQLSLNGNKVSSVNSKAFTGSPSLTMIDLSYNQLADIPATTFLGQLNMALVDLRHNKIVRTPYAAFNRRVTTVLLQENPLVCTEKVHMLQEGTGVFLPNSDDFVCGGQKAIDSAIAQLSQSQVTPGEPALNTESETFANGAPAFVQDSSRKLVSHIESTVESVSPHETGAPSLIPIRPVNEPIVAPAPTSRLQKQKIIEPVTRSRGSFGLDTPIGAGRIEQVETATDATSESTQTTTETAVTDVTTTDNPNIIHPFPVPFLKKPPKIYPAYAAGPVMTQTLPPSIVIAPKKESSEHDTHSQASSEEKFEEFQMDETTRQKMSESFPYEVNQNSSISQSFSSSILIIACVATAAIVMIAVLVGLCFVKHRRVQRYGSSSSSSALARTNAYVAAQAAQMNMIYGTMNRCNSNSNTIGRHDDSNVWMYGTSNYGGGYYQ